MAGENKFASSGSAKETPAGKLLETVVENAERPRDQFDFCRQQSGSIYFVNDWEFRDPTSSASHRPASKSMK